MVLVGLFSSPEPQIGNGNLSHTFYSAHTGFAMTPDLTQNQSTYSGMYNLLIPVYSENSYESIQAYVYLYNEEGEYLGDAISPDAGWERTSWIGYNTPQNFIINLTTYLDAGKYNNSNPVDTMEYNTVGVDFSKQNNADTKLSSYNPYYAQVILLDLKQGNIIANKTIIVSWVD